MQKYFFLINRFEKYVGFPGVLGAIDGILVTAFTPSKKEGAYYSGKKFHGLNCQLTVDTDYMILNIIAHPGSYPDNTIWINSFLKRYMEALR